MTDSFREAEALGCVTESASGTFQSTGRKLWLFYTSLSIEHWTGLMMLENALHCRMSSTSNPFPSILARADSTCVEQRGRKPGGILTQGSAGWRLRL